MNRSFWEKRRVFVTGHTGFKGGWLCMMLREAGAQIAGYALAPQSQPSLYSAADLKRDVRSTIADVRDAKQLEAALSAFAPSIVFHLAAQPLVRASYQRSDETLSTNVMGTVHLLEAVRRVGSVAAAVIVTSDKCYAAGGLERRDENSALGGDDPYSASKACAELVTHAYARAFFENGPGIATARAGNVVGGGDWAADRLVPDLVRAFESGKPARIRNPRAIRPWQHVLDPLEGYAALAERLAGEPRIFAGAWNFGPPADHEVTVSTVADYAAHAWGGGAGWTHDLEDHPRETATLRLDSTKAARRLGWRARVPLDRAIEWTIDWHRRLGAGARAHDLVLETIAKFEAVAA